MEAFIIMDAPQPCWTIALRPCRRRRDTRPHPRKGSGRCRRCAAVWVHQGVPTQQDGHTVRKELGRMGDQALKLRHLVRNFGPGKWIAIGEVDGSDQDSSYPAAPNV